jgi:hypothetical protein
VEILDSKKAREDAFKRAIAIIENNVNHLAIDQKRDDLLVVAILCFALTVLKESKDYIIREVSEVTDNVWGKTEKIK